MAARPGRIRRIAAGARARAAALGTRVVERVRRVYVGARGGISRRLAVARNARERAQSVLAGGTGRIVAMVIGVAAMVALIPALRKVFKLEGRPNAGLWLAAIFLGAAVVFWRVLRKPGWALMAGAVAGFVGGSELLSRWFGGGEQQQLAGNEAPQQLPDRAASSSPVPGFPQRQGGVSVQSGRTGGPVPTGAAAG